MYLNRLSIVGFVGKSANREIQPGRQTNNHDLCCFNPEVERPTRELAGIYPVHTCVGYDRMADSVSRLSKGAHILIEGELTYGHYDRVKRG
jgi:single-stranded DNA-binding protein